jgi:hypothetical protein
MTRKVKKIAGLEAKNRKKVAAQSTRRGGAPRGVASVIGSWTKCWCGKKAWHRGPHQNQ